ncbi:MAG: prepilin-type N-terminal cleavage/methylation domain-containing protein [Thermoanaerobaculia bacterium]
MRRRSRLGAGGFSLIEVMVVTAIVTAILIMVFEIMEDSFHTSMFTESHNDLAVFGQRTVNRLQVEVAQARMLFQDDATGKEYRDALALPATRPVWSDSLLPVVDPAPELNPDSGSGTDRRVGNCLLVAKQLSPVPLACDDDGDPSTPDIEFEADRYRFDFYYLSPNRSRSFADQPYYLDLIESRSVEYADYFQLESLTPSQIAQLVPQLVSRGIERAWDPGEAVSSAFYSLNDASDGVFNPPIRNPAIEQARTDSLLPEFRGGRVSGAMDYSVAFTPAAPAKPFELRTPISRYAVLDSGIPQFPSGFEVKIAGPSGTRKLLSRLVLMSHYGVTKFESQECFVTTSGRF